MKNVLSLNQFSVFLYRILLGFYLLFSLGQRSQDLSIHYSDQGVLTTDDIFKLYDFWVPSVHLLSGNSSFQLGLFLLSALLAVAIIFGHRTKWALFLSWLLLNSLHFRNPWVLDAGDEILLLSLFWTIFLPDELLDSKPVIFKNDKTASIFSMGNLGFIFQLCCIYFFSALLKLQSHWLIDSGGLYYALKSQSTSGIALFLLSFPKEFFKVMNVVVLFLELLGPLLLFIPQKSHLLRKWIPVIFIFFHLSIGFVLEIWRFSIFCMILWIPLLSGEVWKSMHETHMMSFYSITSFSGSILRSFKAIVFWLFLLTIFSANLFSVGIMPIEWMKFFNPILFPTQTHQNWNMFTNELVKVNRRWIFLGVMENGQKVNLSDYSFSPDHLGLRWSNYLGGLDYNGENIHHLRLATILCRSNRLLEVSIQKIEIKDPGHLVMYNKKFRCLLQK